MKKIFYARCFYLASLSLLFAVFSINPNFAQLSLDVSSTENTNCDGQGCDYDGPTILINEIMCHPANGDGSTFSYGDNREGEWIELYNPDQCEWVDISCYFLGNSAPGGSGSVGNPCEPGGFILPEGSVVPPRGFAIVRGRNAPPVPPELLVENDSNTIEIVVDDTNPPCLGDGNRLWFPNAGGWFAFYDENGVAQDAISWNSSSCVDGAPCNPGPAGDCDYAGGLANYNNIPANRKEYVSSDEPSTEMTWSRIPDGGPWSYNNPTSPTYGTCNDDCAPGPEITCNGEATVSVSGGTPPYSYIWDDTMSQLTETATGLCAGTYCVTVTDDTGASGTECVDVHDHQLESSASSNTDLCEGETLNLSASGEPGYDFDWNGPNGYNSNQQNPEIPFAEPSDGGEYSVTVTDDNGCTGEDSENVTVNPLPNPDAGEDQEQCGLEIHLDGSEPQSGNTAYWQLESGPGAADIANTSDPNTLAEVNIPGEYEFAWTEEFMGDESCSETDYVTITFIEILNPTITPIDDMCVSESPVELEMVNEGTVTTSPNIDDAIADGIIDPQQIGPGTYTITNEVDDPCVEGNNPSEITFEIFNEIQVTDFNDQNCISSQADFEVEWTVVGWDGTPTSDYNVNGTPQSTPDFYEVHSSPGNYNYIVTDDHGCSNIVLEGFRDCDCPSPGTMASLEMVTLCEGSCTGDSVSHNQDSIMMSDSDFGYFIHNGDGVHLDYNSTEPDFCRTDFGGAFNQVYYVSAVSGYDDNSNGEVNIGEPCYSAAQGTPVIWMQDPVVNAGSERDTCGLVLPLNGNDVPADMIGYWSSDCNFTAVGGTNYHDPDMIAMVDGYGDCTFTWHIVNGQCVGEDDVVMHFNQDPVPFAGNDTITCGNEIELSAEQSLPGTTFQWSGNANFEPASGATTTVTVGNPGTYELTLTEYNGSCYAQDNILVTFIPGPEPTIQNTEAEVCGSQYNLSVQNVNGDGQWTAWEDTTPTIPDDDLVQIYPNFDDNTSPNTQVSV
ncbi:MAG: hypothetical protein R6V32_12285, partial [Bacteroidales bacterium]